MKIDKSMNFFLNILVPDLLLFTVGAMLGFVLLLAVF